MDYTVKFSDRTNWNLAENDFAAAVRAARDSGMQLFDLTVSNPTACGFIYEPQTWLRSLGRPEAMRYEPGPLGMPSARAAIARYYRDSGAAADVEHICLTTSTSEAYSFLFRLLCNPCDEVLIARPSYPLFDFIAQLDDVRLVEYPLLYDHGWYIDLYTLEQAITPQTRAIVVVHPNNPTGNAVSAAERAALEDLCVRRGLALIVDEVFLDYPVAESKLSSFMTGPSRALTFVLSGLSKVCGLPQMKVSWIAVTGPEGVVAGAMERIEVIVDTFLSMNAPMQYSLPLWLADREGIQEQIRSRVRSNLAMLDARLSGTQANRLAMQGGWTAVLRVPRTVQERPFAEAALRQGVIVQPGEFYDLSEGHAVLSLLTPPSTWAQGLALLPID